MTGPTGEQVARTEYLDRRDAALSGCYGQAHDWRLVQIGSRVLWYCTRCRCLERCYDAEDICL